MWWNWMAQNQREGWQETSHAGDEILWEIQRQEEPTVASHHICFYLFIYLFDLSYSRESDSSECVWVCNAMYCV